MTEQESKPDLLWKDLATEFEEDFILFFFGKELHDAIDFSIKPEYLEQEFNETFAANEPKKKVSDKIIRFRLKNGGVKYVIVHIEFQGQSEKDFVRRMFRYFVYIFIKYDTTDVTALALYTGASRPKVYNLFKASNYGTEISYGFNTYTVREQNEADLLSSENPLAIAVLASLYLIKAGKSDEKKFFFKKKLIEIAITKNFDRAKLFRLLNFVEYLVKLPMKLQLEFKEFTKQPKIDSKMEAERTFLKTYEVFFGKALNEEREEGREEGLEEGLEKGLEKLRQERENTVINLYQNMGVNAEQIANILKYDIEFVQSVLDKLKESKK